MTKKVLWVLATADTAASAQLLFACFPFLLLAILMESTVLLLISAAAGMLVVAIKLLSLSHFKRKKRGASKRRKREKDSNKWVNDDEMLLLTSLEINHSPDSKKESMMLGGSTTLFKATKFEDKLQVYRNARRVPGVSGFSAFDMRRQKLAEAGLPTLRELIVKEYGNDPVVLRLLTDIACYRYLRAREGDPVAAMKLLRSSIRFRKEYNILTQQPRCQYCEKDPLAHATFCIGYDTQDRAVLYSCSARATEQKDVAAGINHIICEMESFLDDNKGIAQVVWVIDFNGFKARHANPELGKHAVNVFQQLYPERLGQIVLLDFPWIFNVFFKLVSSLLDSNTRGKILSLRSKTEQQKYFQENWNPEMVQWMKEISHLPALPGLFPKSKIIRSRYWVD